MSYKKRIAERISKKKAQMKRELDTTIPGNMIAKPGGMNCSQYGKADKNIGRKVSNNPFDQAFLYERKRNTLMSTKNMDSDRLRKMMHKLGAL